MRPEDKWKPRKILRTEPMRCACGRGYRGLVLEIHSVIGIPPQIHYEQRCPKCWIGEIAERVEAKRRAENQA